MRNSLLVFLVSAVFLSACKKKAEAPPEKREPAQAVSPSKGPQVVPREELPELSIFQLKGTWNTQESERIELKDLQGEVLVLVMVYTACQAACPRLIADMRSIESKVSLDKGVKYVFVSIDPERDTPEKLAELAKNSEMQDPKWLFLQGTPHTVRVLANVLAVKYKEISPVDYSHSNIISVFDQKGVLVHQQEGLSVDHGPTVSVIKKLLK